MSRPQSIPRLNLSTKAVYWRQIRRLLAHPKKRTVRYTLLVANLVLLVGVAAFILQSSAPDNSTSRNSLLVSANEVSADPLDKLSSADIAVNVAKLTNLEETTSVANRADSLKAQLSIAPSEDKISNKPQIITTTLKSIKDIKDYKVVEGDTIASIAAKFGVTSESIKESNNITNISAGMTITIPPMNGIIVIVRDGDTPEKLARAYSASAEAIIAFNDAEISGLKPGTKILIPNGAKPTPVYSAPAASVGVSFGWRGYSSGCYDRGWCTDYASAQTGAPCGWGNANTWDNYAVLSGWTVSKTPVPGAIAQSDAGWAGHVGVVKEVSPDGSMIKYCDMNGLAGFNRVGCSDWVPTHSKYQRFIYH